MRIMLITLPAALALMGCDPDCPPGSDKAECDEAIDKEILFPSPYTELSGAPGTLTYGWYVGNSDNGAYCAHQSTVTTGEAGKVSSVKAEVWDSSAAYVPEGIYLAVPWGTHATHNPEPKAGAGTAWSAELTAVVPDTITGSVSIDGDYTLHVAKTDDDDIEYSCETETPGIQVTVRDSSASGAAGAPSPRPPPGR